jgi:transcription-repair coupling factor (superfamily II helicase)
VAKAVGFEYYCELLARSISDVKALDTAEIADWEDQPMAIETPSAQVDLPLPSFIPDDYISDPVLRLEILRDIAALDNPSAVGAFADELKDRFGAPPEEVLNLLAAVNLRNLASMVGLEQLAYNRPRQVFTLQFHGGTPDWTAQVQLVDSRFSYSAQGQLQFDLPFTGPDSVELLAESLATLLELRPKN